MLLNIRANFMNLIDYKPTLDSRSNPEEYVYQMSDPTVYGGPFQISGHW